MELSEKEKKYMLLLKKNQETMYLNYIAIWVFLCTAVVALFIGFKYKLEGALYGAILFAYLGFSVFKVSRIYKNQYEIIEKMKKHIEELEKERNE